jgi:hypothetical protein
MRGRVAMPAAADSPPPSSESSPRNCGVISFGSHAHNRVRLWSDLGNSQRQLFEVRKTGQTPPRHASFTVHRTVHLIPRTLLKAGGQMLSTCCLEPRGIDPSTFENALARVRPRGWCFAHSCHGGIVAICSVWRGVGQKKCEFR